MVIIQTAAEGELLKSLLSIQNVSGYGVLLLFVAYLWWDNRRLKKRIEKVIDNHTNDLKEASQDKNLMIEKWHEFMEEVKDLIRK